MKAQLTTARWRQERVLREALNSYRVETTEDGTHHLYRSHYDHAMGEDDGGEELVAELDENATLQDLVDAAEAHVEATWPQE